MTSAELCPSLRGWGSKLSDFRLPPSSSSKLGPVLALLPVVVVGVVVVVVVD